MAVYSTDKLTGGTASANAEFDGSFVAAYACDNNGGTRWSSTVVAFPHWWKYDFGAGVNYAIEKLTLSSINDGGLKVKNFTLQGSNNDSDFTTVYTGIMADSEGVQTFTFNNNVAYRYYKINITDDYSVTNDAASFYEIEMMIRLDKAAFLLNFI